MHTLQIDTQPNLCPMPCGDCTAVLAAPAGSTLHDLAMAILKAMSFDSDHAFGFFDNLKNTYSSKESYTLFADYGQEEDESAKGVMETLIVDAFPKKKKKLMFLFDYGDDWHFLVTCLGIEEEAKPAESIALVSLTGTPPAQYPNFDE